MVLPLLAFLRLFSSRLLVDPNSYPQRTTSSGSLTPRRSSSDTFSPRRPSSGTSTRRDKSIDSNGENPLLSIPLFASDFKSSFDCQIC